MRRRVVVVVVVVEEGKGEEGEEKKLGLHHVGCAEFQEGSERKGCGDRMLGPESRVHEETQAPVLNCPTYDGNN